MFFEKYTLLFDTSFWLFGFSIFISSYQVKLGRLALVWIDCRKFCALFSFVGCVPFFLFPPSFVQIYFSQQIFGFFFFPQDLPFWNLPAGIP